MLRIIADSTSIPCDTLVSITPNGENGIFVIPAKNKDENSKLNFTNSKDGICKIREVISKLKWSCDYNIIFDEENTNFFVNIEYIKKLEGNLLPLNSFSSEFDENFILYFNLNTKVELTYKEQQQHFL